TSAAIYGGVEMGPQERALKAGVDIIVATPGRLIDHMRQENADLSGIELLVLDEADRMMDMGFWPDVRRIIAASPAQRQTPPSPPVAVRISGASPSRDSRADATRCSSRPTSPRAVSTSTAFTR